MINEFRQGLFATVGLMAVVVAGFFWWMGGRSNPYLGIRNRHWGRIIAPLFFCLSMCGLSVWVGKWDWRYLLSFPVYISAQYLVGYGGNNLFEKIIRRTIWSWVMTAAGVLSFAVWSGAWDVGWSQFCLGWFVAVYWGVRNPKPAPMEECFIKTMAVVAVPFMVI